MSAAASLFDLMFFTEHMDAQVELEEPAGTS
jgi:hypothetical protein